MRRLKWLGALALMALMLVNAQAAFRGAARAAAYWYTSVAPALLPFMALMPLLTGPEACRAYERLLGGAMSALFGLPGASASALIVGMVSGAPAGAIAARNVARRARMDQGQLNRLAACSFGFSPAFLVGGIGGGMLGNVALGWRLLEAQLLTQLTLASVLRFAWRDLKAPVAIPEGSTNNRSMGDAVGTVLIICGYMMLFGALGSVVGEYLGAGPANIAVCLLDVPSGARYVAGLSILEGLKLPLLSAMCGFGGFCALMQCLGVLEGSGVNASEFLSIRALAGLVSAGYTALLMRIGNDGAIRMAAWIQRKPLEAASLMAALSGLAVIFLAGKSYLNIIKNREI